jgi:hypothetical protein
MKRVSKDVKDVDDIFSDWFPEAMNQACERMVLVQDRGKSTDPPEVLSIRATREGCEIKFKWGKLAAVMAGM